MVIKDLCLTQKVTWDEKVYPNILHDMIKEYGEGTFSVVGLRLRNPDGEANWSLSVAPYMVTVKLANGEKHESAGEWFKRVE